MVINRRKIEYDKRMVVIHRVKVWLIDQIAENLVTTSRQVGNDC